MKRAACTKGFLKPVMKKATTSTSTAVPPQRYDMLGTQLVCLPRLACPLLFTANVLASLSRVFIVFFFISTLKLCSGVHFQLFSNSFLCSFPLRRRMFSWQSNSVEGIVTYFHLILFWFLWRFNIYFWRPFQLLSLQCL